MEAVFLVALTTTSSVVVSTSVVVSAFAAFADFFDARLRAPFGTIAITSNPHLGTY
jgi:hypothetical protein